MRINYNCTGDRKKQMVKAIGEALEEQPIYQGVPSCAYQIAEFRVTRDGDLEFQDDTDTEIVNGLIDSLEEAGFMFPESDADTDSIDSVGTEENTSAETETGESDGTSEEENTNDKASVTANTDEASNVVANSTETEENEAPTELTISLPLMPLDALDRLRKLVDGKASLIQKALNTDSLAITLTDKLNFPWWKHMPEQDEVAAYMAFLIMEVN